MLKKSISVILATMIIINFMLITTITARAETVTGNAGSNIFWSIDTNTGEMQITGSGNMNDSYSEWQYTPYSVKYRNYVTKATVQEGITSIGNNAFCCFEKMQEVSIPSTATKIGYYAFNNLFIIESISAQSVSFVDNHAFYNCYKLKNIDLGQRLTRLNAYAFGNCTSIEQIYLPKTLTIVERYAFTNCSSLKDVYYGGSEEEWNSISIAYGNDNLLNAHIHYNSDGNSGSDDSYSSKYGWCLSNNHESYGYDPNYKISMKEYFSFFGVNLSSLINSLNNVSKWNGNCFGLSLLSLAQYYHIIDLKPYFSKSGESLYDFGYESIYSDPQGNQCFSVKGNDDAIALIEKALFSQYAVEFTKFQVFKDNSNYSQLLGFLNSSDAKPILVNMYNGDSAHSMVITTDIKPEKIDSNSDWYKIPVYDPNAPVNSTKLSKPMSYYKRGVSWLLINPSTSEWRYEMGGIVRYSQKYYVGWGTKRWGLNNIGGRTIEFYDVSNMDSSFFTKQLNVWHKHIQLHFCSSNIQIKDKNNKTLFFMENDTIKEMNEDCIIETGVDYNSTNLKPCFTFYTDEELLFVDTDESEILAINTNYAYKSLSNERSHVVFDFSNGAIFANNDDLFSIAIQNLAQNKTIAIENNSSESSSVSVEIDANGNGLVKSNSTDLDVELDGIEEENVKIEKINTQKGTTGDCTWELTEDGVLTISGNGAMGDYAWNDELPWGTSIKKVVVQSGVTTIGSHAFYKCSDLSEVFLPNTLSEIKSSAFRWCSNLVCTELPEGLTVIKDNAFRDCSRLTEIVIPSSVNYIEELSFTNCEKLSTFYVSSNNPYFCSCDGLLYNKSSSELLYCPTAKTTVTIPEGVKKISRFAFHESKICSVVLPDSLDTIDYCSFRDCKYLQNIKFPNSITYIDGYAFAGCTGLTSVTISDSVTSIGDYTFYGCTGLTSVTIPNSVTSIGKNAFSNCSSDLIIYGYSGSYAQTYANNNGLVFVELNNVTECSGITGDCTWKLTEDGVLTISGNGRMGDYSFENVAPWGTGVKKIIINDGVSNIGKCAFCKCTQLTDVSIPDSVESIDYSAFRLCDKLVNVALPKNLKSIGDYSFAWCQSIKSITFSNELVSIGKMAFRACSELTKISIPSKVIYIEGGAFAWCINLSCINVESGNNKYDSRNNCNAIIETKTNKIIQSCNSTIIPNGIECIGDCAFLGCSKLDKITIPDSVTVIGESAFHSCLGLKKIVIPSTVVTLGGWSFAYCTYLTEIEIPKSVTSIGDDAFYASQKINIYGNVDSYAQLYANMYSIPFIEIKDTPFLAGDTNLDGKISISDVTEIQKYLAEIIDFSDEQLLLADTNGDGIISISDATHLQKYLAEFDGIVLGKQSA